MQNRNYLISILFFSVLLINPGFSQSPANWSRDEINPGEDFYLTAEESFFTEGVRSLRVQLNSGAVPYLISDIYFITPGAEYEFSVDVFDNDTSGQVKVYADFYDTYGFNIFGEQPVFSQDSSEWQTISWHGTVPAQAVVGYVLLKFHTQPDLYHFTKPAEILIDNLQFRQAGGNNIVANGGFEVWQVGIGENEDAGNLLKVYPNPANNVLNILLPEKSEELIIRDMLGRMVCQKPLYNEENPHQINLDQLSEGVFMISVLLEDGSFLRGKFIKCSGY